MVLRSSPPSSTASLFSKQICFSLMLGRSNINPDIIKIPPPRPCLVYNGNLNDRYITSVSIVRLLTPNSHARFSRVSNRRLHNARRIAHRLSNAVMFSPYTFFCSLQPFTTATNRPSPIYVAPCGNVLSWFSLIYVARNANSRRKKTKPSSPAKHWCSLPDYNQPHSDGIVSRVSQSLKTAPNKAILSIF